MFDDFENLRCIKVHTEKMKNYCGQHNYPYEFIEDTKPARRSAKKLHHQKLLLLPEK